MGFKSLFVKEDEDEIVESKTKKSTPPAFQAPQNISSLGNAQQFAAPAISPQEKNEFAEFLNEVYQKGNFPGPDYQEFTDALKEMDSIPMDDKTKFNAIYAGFKVQGVTKARLLETAQKYIVLIQGQVTDFSKEIDNMLSGDVVAKQKTITQISKENEDIEKQMISLTEKKNRNNELIQKLTTEVSEQTFTLNSKKISFEAAASEFTSKVQTNVEKIKTYLPDTISK